MFSPSQLVQSMVQRSFVSDPKPVELKPGQVFQGTVIRHYPENMALVQIGGIQVQAKLEARLETGQKAWLQVQPNAGVVTLKVLDTPAPNSGKEGMLNALIRSLGLSETKEIRTIVQALVNAGLPVTKEVVQAFQAVAQRLGAEERTVQAFLLAMKRELPLTPDTIAGLKAFLSEKTLGQAVQTFLQQASLFLEGNEPTRSAKQASASLATGQTADVASPDVRQWVQQIREKLSGIPVQQLTAEEGMPAELPGKQQLLTGKAQDGRNLSEAGKLPAQGSADAQTDLRAEGRVQTALPANGRGTLPEQMAAIRNFSGVETAPAGVNNPAILKAGPDQTGGPAASAVPNVPLPNGKTPFEQGGQPVEGKAALPPFASGQADRQRETGQFLPMAAAVNERDRTALQGQPQAKPAPTGAGAAAKPSDPQVAFPAAEPSVQDQAAPGSVRNPILDWFRQMGVLHERELMTRNVSADSGEAGTLKHMENVKALLIQLTQSTSSFVPHALREAADQLLQQVTGQQLMLLSPSSQILSQVVMQIPLRTADGQETAYVQIESQKKGTGQLDAENCRLFFHLELQQLGTTMIDVNIVNKIVNLHMYNDTPGIEKMVQTARDGLAEQLQGAGYQLSAMRVQAIPEQKHKADASGGSAPAFMAPYRGVDLRI